MRSLREAERKALTLVELRIMAAKAGLRYCSDLKKKDLMDPILGKRQAEVKMTHYVLMDMTRKRGRKNHLR